MNKQSDFTLTVEEVLGEFMDNWDFHGQEARDGLRFSWNVWPSTRIEATRLVVPFGCLYSPLKKIENMPGALAYDPIRCNGNGCGAILNPYVYVLCA